MSGTVNIHELESLESSNIDPAAEFIVNNSSQGIIEANKITLSQIIGNLADKDLSNLSSTGQATIDGKASAALDNLTASGKLAASNLSAMSSQYATITIGASGSTYTMPENGWLVVRAQTTNSTNTSSRIDYQGFYYSLTGGGLQGTRGCIALFFPKNALVTFTYDSNVTMEARFYYSVGSYSGS